MPSRVEPAMRIQSGPYVALRSPVVICLRCLVRPIEAERCLVIPSLPCLATTRRTSPGQAMPCLACLAAPSGNHPRRDLTLQACLAMRRKPIAEANSGYHAKESRGQWAVQFVRRGSQQLHLRHISLAVNKVNLPNRHDFVYYVSP